MLKDKRAVFKTGNSKAMTIPAKIETGEVATLAGNRLLLIDPTGEISEDHLLEFMKRIVEPNFWPWIKEKEAQ